MSSSESNTVDAVVNQQRAIQKMQDKLDAAAPNRPQQQDQVIQTGAREYPGAPMPSQHMEKPGCEADMVLKPQFLAPDYIGSAKLKGQVAIITGATPELGAPLPYSMPGKAPTLQLFISMNTKMLNKPDTTSRRKVSNVFC